MKFDGYVLVSDIDGTLVNRKWEVTQENREAIAYFQREGGKFTLATGRIAGRVKQIQRQVHVDLPVICYNGACIYHLDTGETYWQHLLDEDVTTVADEVLANVSDVSIQIYANHNIYLYQQNPKAVYTTFLLDEHVIRVDDYKMTPKPWAKLMFIVQADKMQQVRDCVSCSSQRGQFNFVQSAPEYYEVLHPLTSKGNALESLAAMQGLSMDKIIAVGDNENDIDMVRKAKYGFMTKDAEPAYQKEADFICGSCETNSIATVIEKMEEIVL